MGKYIIGIDLGTTNSAVSIYENGQPKILENSLGKRTTPSVVALSQKKDKKTKEVIGEEWMVGENAKRQAVVNSLNTISGVKRLIGRRFDDPEVNKMKELAAYKIVEGPNGDAWVEVGGKAMAPAEISAKVLRELKTAVEKYLGEEVTEAVITVPAYFNNEQRQATKDAGKIAGLDVKRIINEPTAAALAYGMDKKENGTVVVFDLGGGTFDVSVLEVMIDEKEGSLIEVKSTNGDTFLGGENFDERIIDHLIEVASGDTDNGGFGLDEDTVRSPQVLGRLKEAAEKAKIELSMQEISTVNLPFLAQGEDGPVNFEYDLTRATLEKLVGDLVKKTIQPCKDALKDAGLTMADIDEVILVGGQTRMPMVIDTVREFFGKEPRKDVNPDEIVSMGASVQGAIIDGKVENVLLLDVIPLSIGLRAKDDVMSVLIPRNSTIPTEKSEVFTTAEDNQPNVEIKVYQGERPLVTGNKLLGKFSLDLPPLPQGVPQIEVTFKIDADGVLDVEAKDQKSGRAQKITVQANGGLSDAEVESMLKEADQHADEDRAFRELQVAGANAAEVLHSASKDEEQEYFQAAPEELKETFRTTVKELTEAVQKKDVPVMVAKTDALKKVRSAIGEAFYNASAAAPATDPASNDNDAAAEAPAAEEAPKAPKAKKPPEGPAAA